MKRKKRTFANTPVGYVGQDADFLWDPQPNYEVQIIWEDPTPAAAALPLHPARQASSVWW